MKSLGKLSGKDIPGTPAVAVQRSEDTCQEQELCKRGHLCNTGLLCVLISWPRDPPGSAGRCWGCSGSYPCRTAPGTWAAGSALTSPNPMAELWSDHGAAAIGVSRQQPGWLAFRVPTAGSWASFPQAFPWNEKKDAETRGWMTQDWEQWCTACWCNLCPAQRRMPGWKFTTPVCYWGVANEFSVSWMTLLPAGG